MTPLAQAVRELRDEMEARAIEVLAMAQVQPEIAEKWTAQAMALSLAWAGMRQTGAGLNSDSSIALLASALINNKFRQEIAALVERRRQEAKEAHG